MSRLTTTGTAPERRDPRAVLRGVLRGALRWLPAALVLGCLVGAWELYTDLGGIDAFVLPAPHQIASSLWTDRGLLWSNFTVTAGEVMLGILAALAAGVAAAIAIHFSRAARGAIYPLLIGSQTVPVVIIAPLLVAWLGFGTGPKVAITALVCFFPITVNTLAGLRAVDPDLLKLMSTLDASRLQVFRRVEAPTALPAALAGTKIAVAVALIGAVFGEWSGSSAGLGHLILQAIPQFETAQAYAAVVVLSAFALALFGALSAFERRAVPWAYRNRGGSA